VRLIMCVGFPGQVTAVDDLGATVKTLGRERRASTLLLPDVLVGDWVYVAAGTIVERLDPVEAAAIRKLLLEAAALEAAEAAQRP
ncbi:MAG TPA: HypC/HybG/HupF family hydrogenase formation chaperone, partial [Candidatus Limnocylindrales bacterium]|nr:HypC/HybG/HupF family hydrogenase formation chaperone [Candidatus Limnocylindrales bacterium]